MKLATLCYIRRGEKTLMLHRNKRADDYHYGKWNGLGGKLLPGETPEEGVAREVLEESSLRLESYRLCGMLTFPLFDGKDDWYVFVFEGRSENGEVRNPPEGELAWIDSSKILELDLWPGDRVFLPWLEQPAFFSAKIVYDRGSLVSTEVEFYGIEANKS